MVGIPRPSNFYRASATVDAAAIIDGVVSEPKLAADDEVASRFWLGPVEHDFGSSASAVATKLTDAAPCKLEVLMALLTLVEAKAGGTVDDTTTLAKEEAGTTAMTAVHTLDMSEAGSNVLNETMGMAGLATADSQVAEGADIWIVTAAATSRTAGKYSVMALCKKIA